MNEQRWVDCLITLSPFGLNKVAPNWVSDSISNISRWACLSEWAKKFFLYSFIIFVI
jgi:hypothetical protein